jgi:hypothetical protein
VLGVALALELVVDAELDDLRPYRIEACGQLGARTRLDALLEGRLDLLVLGEIAVALDALAPQVGVRVRG